MAVSPTVLLFILGLLILTSLALSVVALTQKQSSGFACSEGQCQFHDPATGLSLTLHTGSDSKNRITGPQLTVAQDSIPVNTTVFMEAWKPGAVAAFPNGQQQIQFVQSKTGSRPNPQEFPTPLNNWTAISMTGQ